MFEDIEYEEKAGMETMEIKLTRNEIRSLYSACYCSASEAIDEDEYAWYMEIAKKLEGFLTH